MAGESAGSQGAVQVWAPERWRLRLGAIAWSLIVILMLSLLLISILHSHDPAQVLFGVGYLLFFVTAAAAAYATIRQPCYLTTDDTGIGIRMAGGGTRSLRWCDIVWMERKWCALFLLTPSDPGKTLLYLSGYPRSVRKAVETLIAERAELVHNQFTRNSCWYSSKDSGNPEFSGPVNPPLNSPAQPENALNPGDRSSFVAPTDRPAPYPSPASPYTR